MKTTPTPAAPAPLLTFYEELNDFTFRLARFAEALPEIPGVLNDLNQPPTVEQHRRTILEGLLRHRLRPALGALGNAEALTVESVRRHHCEQCLRPLRPTLAQAMAYVQAIGRRIGPPTLD